MLVDDGVVVMFGGEVMGDSCLEVAGGWSPFLGSEVQPQREGQSGDALGGATDRLGGVEGGEEFSGVGDKGEVKGDGGVGV